MLQISSGAVDQESIGIVVEDLKARRNREFKLIVLNSSTSNVIEVSQVASKDIYLLDTRQTI